MTWQQSHGGTHLKEADIRTAEAEAALLARKFIDYLPQQV